MAVAIELGQLLAEIDPNEDREARPLQTMLAKIDGIAQRAEDKTPTRRALRLAKAAAPREPIKTVFEAQRIPKGRGSEVRVAIKSMHGGRVCIDVRQWSQVKGSLEWRPTARGIALDVGKLPALIESLRVASLEVPSR